MKIIVCPKCKTPYKDSEAKCPNCGEVSAEYVSQQETVVATSSKSYEFSIKNPEWWYPLSLFLSTAIGLFLSCKLWITGRFSDYYYDHFYIYGSTYGIDGDSGYVTTMILVYLVGVASMSFCMYKIHNDKTCNKVLLMIMFLMLFWCTKMATSCGLLCLNNDSSSIVFGVLLFIPIGYFLISILYVFFCYKKWTTLQYLTSIISAILICCEWFVITYYFRY